MVPMVTVHHFSDPIWVAERGGWETRDIVDLFQRFTGRVVEALKDYVDLWVTINEPNVLATSAYLFGDFPPGKNNLRTMFQVMGNLAVSHTAAYKKIHEIQPNAQVGLAVNYRGLVPARTWSPLDKFVTRLQSSIFNNFFPAAAVKGVLSYPLYRKSIPQGKDCLDFLGINYYTQDCVGFNLLHPQELFGHRDFPEGAQLSETGHIANLPEGFFRAIKWGLRYEKPIIITENGVEDSKDTLRPRYIIQHLHQLWRAVNFNYPVRGYYHWSLVDNFEWERGWTQRFGLWELDLKTQQRIKRRSADLYAEICEENGISSGMVARYAPELLPGLFPG
jgi:beta-glucosidase